MLIGARTAAWGGKALPYKKRLQYAHIGNGQYFVTGWTVTQTPSSFDTFQANLRVTALTSAWDWYFGGWDQAAGRGTFFRRQNATSYLNTGTYFKSLSGAEGNPQLNWGISPITSDFIDAGINASGAFFGSTSKSYGVSVFSYTMPFVVGGMPVDDQILYTGSEMDLASLKLYALGATLAHDVYPVVDNSNVVCFYDEVSGEFFYNVGSGAFTAGPDYEGGGLTSLCLLALLAPFSSRWRDSARQSARHFSSWEVAA